MRRFIVGLLSFLIIPVLMSCIAQKTVGVTFTESGKGAGIYSGLIEKTNYATPATLPSDKDSNAEAIALLEFTAKENGSRDGYPFQISEVRISTSGTADIADLRFVIDGPGINNVTGTNSGTTVTFKDFGDIIVTDGDQTGKTYQIKALLRPNIQGTLADNSTLTIQLNPLDDISVASASSNLLQSAASMASTATTITVTATELQGKGTLSFGTTNTFGAFPNQVMLYATDVNGRVDKDYVTNITVIARQTDCTSAQAGLSTTDGTLTHTPVQGVATWTNMSFGIVLTTFKVYATSGALTAQCSAAITTPNP